MGLILNHDYEKGLRNQKPTIFKEKTIHSPFGGLFNIRKTKKVEIPPLNTDIQYNILPEFHVKDHSGLMALDHEKLPLNFNWREDSNKKLSKPGNQLLCGSCWAISTAGIISDNFITKNIVKENPSLSTTWSLSCYPQFQCKGGNPAKLFEDIAKNGIVSNRCVDYSWCKKNNSCNGKATKHFKSGNINLSNLVPNCGCYNNKANHYRYFIEKPKNISLGMGGLNSIEMFRNTVKKHIFHNGPISGGFIVFKNFMHGDFTKVNKGIYLENGVYDKGSLHFDKKQSSSSSYIGSHAVAIIGWGEEENVIIDNKGTKKTVPFWYCRNSWTENWGDSGYFKMAMYPFNKISQFDKIVKLSTPSGNKIAGGMITFSVNFPPKLVKNPQISEKFLSQPRERDEKYYNENETITKGNSNDNPIKSEKEKNDEKHISILKILVLLSILFLVYLIFTRVRKPKTIQNGFEQTLDKPFQNDFEQTLDEPFQNNFEQTLDKPFNFNLETPF